MPAKNSLQRVAFSPGEFAALFGKQQTWGYRQIYAGKVNAITEHGRILIPAAEVERILAKAGTYNGLKVKVRVPKRAKKLDVWRRFIAKRRKAKNASVSQPGTESEVVGLRPALGNARASALKRLPKGKPK